MKYFFLCPILYSLFLYDYDKPKYLGKKRKKETNATMYELLN